MLNSLTHRTFNLSMSALRHAARALDSGWRPSRIGATNSHVRTSNAARRPAPFVALTSVPKRDNPLRTSSRCCGRTAERALWCERHRPARKTARAGIFMRPSVRGCQGRMIPDPSVPTKKSGSSGSVRESDRMTAMMPAEVCEQERGWPGCSVLAPENTLDHHVMRWNCRPECDAGLAVRR